MLEGILSWIIDEIKQKYQKLLYMSLIWFAYQWCIAIEGTREHFGGNMRGNRDTLCEGFQCVGNIVKWVNANLRQRGLAHHDYVED